jgi:hypothetical protein
VLYTYERVPVSIEILSSLRLSETGVAAAFGGGADAGQRAGARIGARR